MTNIQIATAILTLVAGVGVFLVACSMMSKNLETLGSGKLRDLFSSASKSKLLGVGIGTLCAVAIQSSGATTVIAIGFLNAGIMSLTQAATVIFGANIGTTVTGQIVAWGMSGGDSLSTTVIFSGLAGIGAFVTTFAKSDRVKTIGSILTGFGMLFVGLEMMGGAMKSFADYQPVRDFLASISNPVLLVVIGAVLTAIIESSSVMTSVAITMIMAGLITFDQGIFITMGSNIGACIVSLLAGMAGSTNAKRAPVINLTLNIGGAIIFLALAFVLGMVSGGALGLGTPFEAMFPSMPQVQLAMFHTVYNVLKVAIALPFTGLIVRFAQRLIPDEPEPAGDVAPELRTYYISEQLFLTPPIAVAQTKNEIVRMANIALANFNLSLDMARTLDFSTRGEFERNEDELNFLNREMAKYIARLFGERLSESDREYLSKALHSISDLERVGDYSTNIVEYAEKLREVGQGFSEDAQEEIRDLQELVEGLFVEVMKGYVTGDAEALANARSIEAEVDVMSGDMAQGHVQRMADGRCTPEVGAHYLSLVNDAERVSDHFFNLAKTVKGL